MTMKSIIAALTLAVAAPSSVALADVTFRGSVNWGTQNDSRPVIITRERAPMRVYQQRQWRTYEREREQAVELQPGEVVSLGAAHLNRSTTFDLGKLRNVDALTFRYAGTRGGNTIISDVDVTFGNGRTQRFHLGDALTPMADKQYTRELQLNGRTVRSVTVYGYSQHDIARFELIARAR